MKEKERENERVREQRGREVGRREGRREGRRGSLTCMQKVNHCLFSLALYQHMSHPMTEEHSLTRQTHM